MKSFLLLANKNKSIDFFIRKMKAVKMKAKEKKAGEDFIYFNSWAKGIQ